MPKTKKKSSSKVKKEKSKHNGNGESDVEGKETALKADDPSQPESKKKVSVEFDSAIQRDEAVSYFETLVAGLKKGSIHLRQNGEELTLTPPSQIEVRVKASRKKEKEKLSFEIHWRTSSGSELQISSE